jgi:hypothetical protein
VVLQSEVVDTEVFKKVGEFIVKIEDFNYGISGEQLIKLMNHLPITEDQITKSLEMLYHENLITLDKSCSLSHFDIHFTSEGFLCYGEQFISDFSQIIKKVVSIIYNKELVEKISLDTDISRKAEVPIAIVDLLLKAYEDFNYIDCVRFAGYTQVDEITTLGKIEFEKILHEF